MPEITPPALALLIGQSVHAIDTPALVVDLDAMQRNLQRMAEFAAQHQVRWRAHAKMHKCSTLARLQVAHGAVGVCVQTVAEAEAMAEGSMRDIFITNEVLAAPKLARVAWLAHKLAGAGGRLGIAVDSALGVTRLAQAMQDAARMAGDGLDGDTTIDVYVEVNVGQDRCGVLPGEPVLALAWLIDQHPDHLHFAGLQAYLGHAQHLRTPAERRQAVDEAVAQLRETRELLVNHGLEVPLVTGAGTGSMVNEATSGLYGELQAGSFLFMDADYAANGWDAAQPDFEHALFVKSRIISAAPGRVVCDGGHKSHAIDTGMPAVLSLPGQPALVYAKASDEHGVLYPADGGMSPLPALDDTVWLIPGHCDPTVNLHSHLLGVSGGLANGRVEKVFTVDARGGTPHG